MQKVDADGARKGVAYNATPVFGSAENIRVEARDFLLHTQFMLLLQNVLWDKAAVINITKIVILWCPLIEPGHLSEITLSVKYDNGGEEDNINDDDVVVRTWGRATEQLMVTVYPSTPVIKVKSHAFYNPWSIDVDIRDCTTTGRRNMIGIVKTWCHIKIKTFLSHKKTTMKEYVCPDVKWSNVYYPYYVPFYVMQKVRGIDPVRWRDTLQYLAFANDVKAHVHHLSSAEGEVLGLMQILSKEDLAVLNNLTKDCHIRKGGTCTCGSKPSQFLASVAKNQTGHCANHGQIFDDIAVSILTGNTKTIPDAQHIRF